MACHASNIWVNTMNKGYELIEQLLESLINARKQIDREIQNLINRGFEESDFKELQKAVDLVTRHDSITDNFLYHILSDDFNSKETRDAILQQKLFLVMQRTAPNEARNVMDKFSSMLEKKLNESPPNP